MRSFAILATVFAATVGTTSALVDARERTDVYVDANGYDTNTNNCSPSGCVPYNTRDDDTSANSRWSCKGEILHSSDREDGCCIWYSFEEAQDIKKIQIALHQGNTRKRCMNVFHKEEGDREGDLIDTITSSGRTNGFETTDLYTDETKELKLCLCDPEDNEDVWLSITEVRLLVE